MSTGFCGMLVDHPGWAALAVAISAIAVTIDTHAGRAAECEQAAVAAERDAGLPGGLLQAIGRIETGRRDPGHERISGQTLSVNAGQEGRRFTTRAAATGYVESQLASGRDLVDIGCFQIDLHYHPHAFADWRQGFDPVTNAAAASRILHALYVRSGDWNQAIALYHSADPERGGSYLHAVLRAWTSGLGLDAAIGAPSARPDPYTILVSMRASQVVVWSPVQTGVSPAQGGPELPAVITP